MARPLFWWAAWLAADLAAAVLRGVADTLHEWRDRKPNVASRRPGKRRRKAKKR
ncbi:MAG TPA: hypothetical protein VI818_06725 [Candidatus Thermoplasmatota archaeon]|nr:hypothetical protein [Candidatus Thermoplasmatota archaeon]